MGRHPAEAFADCEKSAPESWAPEGRRGARRVLAKPAVNGEAEALVAELAELLQVYGTPTHHLEDAVDRLAHRLGVEATVFATPTSLQIGFGKTANQRLHLRRVSAGELDLGRLVELDELVTMITDDPSRVAEVRRRLAKLREAPPRYRRATIWAAYAVASGTAASLFGGTWREILISALLASSLGPLAEWLGRRPGSAGLLHPVASFGVSFIAFGLAAMGLGISGDIAVISGLIALVPGLTLTVALTELATGHVVSGTARLAGTGSVFVLMLLGVVMGHTAAERVFGVIPEIVANPYAWIWPLALALAPLAFVVIFSARRREAGWIWLGGVGGVLVARTMGTFAGAELASFAGALFVGLLSNELDRRGRLPASVMRAPGLILLVPGSMGFRSLEALYRHEAVHGIEGIFTTALVGAALAGGLLVANLIRAPRGG